MNETPKWNRISKDVKLYTDQPFPVTLKPFLVKPLHSNHHACPRSCSHERILVNPPLKNRTKTTFS